MFNDGVCLMGENNRKRLWKVTSVRSGQMRRFSFEKAKKQTYLTNVF